MKEIKFENYIKMIDKKAWEVSKKTGVDFEELQAYGALIYCYVLERYDVSKASFSTILYLSLGRLYEYAYKDIGKTCELEEEVERAIQAPEDSPKVDELLELAAEKLSDDACNLIEWLVKRSWEFQGRVKPCLSMVARNFGWKKGYAKSIWLECKSFWNEFGWALYS